MCTVAYVALKIQKYFFAKTFLVKRPLNNMFTFSKLFFIKFTSNGFLK